MRHLSMTRVIRKDVIIPATFLLISALFTVIMYIAIVAQNESDIIRQIEQTILLYGYANSCSGFIIGYAILRSYVDADYLESDGIKHGDPVCSLCSARVALI